MIVAVLAAACLLELAAIVRLVVMLRAQLRRPTNLIKARLVDGKRLQPDLPRRQRRAMARHR